MPQGGEAVAEVLRHIPSARWFAWSFARSVLGFHPFQRLLYLAYAILAAARPLFGCESCGTPSAWLRPFATLKRVARALFGKRPHSISETLPHATPARRPRSLQPVASSAAI